MSDLTASNATVTTPEPSQRLSTAMTAMMQQIRLDLYRVAGSSKGILMFWLLFGIIALPLLYCFTSQRAMSVIVGIVAVIALLFVGIVKQFPETCQMLATGFDSMMQHNPAVLMVAAIVVEVILLVVSYRIAKRVWQSKSM